MAMLGCAGAEIEVVDGMHAGQSHVVVACQEIPDHFPSARQYTDDTR